MSYDGWSPIDMSGQVVFAAKTITADYTPTEATETLLIDCSAGTVNITLPQTTTYGSTEYRIVKIDGSANYVYINASGSDTIMGILQVVIQDQWGSFDLVASSNLYVAMGAI